MRNLQCQRIFQANAPVNSVTLHPNQHELIVGDQNGAVHIWNLRAESASEAHSPEPSSSIQCVAVDQQGTKIAAITNKGNCYVSPSASEEQDENTPETNIAGQQKIQNTKSILPCRKIAAHRQYGLRCKFSPDSSVLVTSSADQRYMLLNYEVTCMQWS